MCMCTKMADPAEVPLEEPEYCVIETDRLRLRTLRVSDASLMMPILTDPEIMKWTVGIR